MKFLLFLFCAWALVAPAGAQHLKPALIPTMGGERVGYKRADEVVLKPVYEAGDEFDQLGLAVVALGGRYGMIDSTGKVVVPCKYKTLSHFSEGLAAASVDGQKVGFVNRAGVLVIPCTYDDAGDFHEGVTTVIRGNKCALLSRKGVLLTLFKYQGIEAMQGGIARVCLKNDSRDGVEFSNFWGFINQQGREITKLNCYGHDSKNTGTGFCIATVSLPGRAPTYNGEYRAALVDKTGRVVIPASAGYTFGEFTDRYLRVHRDFPQGVVDYTGKVILPVNFWRITDFAYGPGKSLAQAYTSERDFFYVNEQWQCVEFDGVKCPKY